MTNAARWHEFAYEQTDIPAGMTVRDWRIQRARRLATPRCWSRIVGVLHRGERHGCASDRASERCRD